MCVCVREREGGIKVRSAEVSISRSRCEVE
jgi:hypothetical protein